MGGPRRFVKSRSILSRANAADLVAFLDAVGAVDRPSDDRPIAIRSDQVFSYMALVSPRTEPDVWVFAVDAVDAELRGEPEALRDRAQQLRARLASLRAAAEGSGPRVPIFTEARSLRVELSRFAADKGAVTSPR